jgi:hypothetical protein
LVHVATYIYYIRELEKGPGEGKWKGKMAGDHDCSTQRGSPRAQSKPKDMFSMWTGRPF